MSHLDVRSAQRNAGVCTSFCRVTHMQRTRIGRYMLRRGVCPSVCLSHGPIQDGKGGLSQRLGDESPLVAFRDETQKEVWGTLFPLEVIMTYSEGKQEKI